MANPTRPYSIFKISKSSPDLPAMAQKYKSLRLAALKNSPEVYFSSFSIDTSGNEWAERLKSQTSKCLYLLARPAQPSGEILIGKRTSWLVLVGALTLMGPMSQESFDSIVINPDMTVDNEARRQLCNFVHQFRKSRLRYRLYAIQSGDEPRLIFDATESAGPNIGRASEL
ncbi:hypothetical protein V1506DRAFT_505804 [Lipomyces tetrasporus]